MAERYKTVIFAAVILAISAGVIALLTYHPAPVVITIIPPGPSPTPLPIRVYVIGAVEAPDTYSLPYGSRVEDAVAAAGGAKSDADVASINLAQVLHDGDKVSVPSLAVMNSPAATAIPATLVSAGVTTSTGNTGQTSANPTAAKSSASGKGGTIVHINTASLEELQALPGVGPALAQKIIDYRTAHGPIKNMADLDNVPGVGQSRLKEWANLVAFD